MKKMFLTLAVLAALTACSSTEEVKDTPIVEEIVIVEPVIVETEVIEAIQVEIDQPVVENVKTIYDKDGIIVTSENNEITLTMPTDVTFDFDKSNVNENFMPMLNVVAEALKANSDITANISGHTDSIGTEDYNQKLSTIRAEEVKNYLVSQGIDSEKVTTIGYGFEKPVASNETIDGRERNRRIEITLTK